MERCGHRAQGRSRIIAPLDPNERGRSFYRDDIDRCRMLSREIQQAGTQDRAFIYVPFDPDPLKLGQSGIAVGCQNGSA
ncbi:MAG: hypothetical protein ACI8XO_000528 [Verrucomicrobiales bacterium]|jgi:hypothetical protein